MLLFFCILEIDFSNSGPRPQFAFKLQYQKHHNKKTKKKKKTPRIINHLQQWKGEGVKLSSFRITHALLILLFLQCVPLVLDYDFKTFKLNTTMYLFLLRTTTAFYSLGFELLKLKYTAGTIKWQWRVDGRKGCRAVPSPGAPKNFL